MFTLAQLSTFLPREIIAESVTARVCAFKVRGTERSSAEMIDNEKSFDAVRMTFEEGKKCSERIVDRCGFDVRGCAPPDNVETRRFPFPSPVAYKDKSGATSNAVI